MAYSPTLAGAVTYWALFPVASSARGKESGVVAQDTRAPWLIEGNPMFALRNRSKESLGVMPKILDKFLLVQHTAISLVQSIRQIPMKQGDHRCDTRSQKIIDKLHIESQASRIYGVFASTEWNDSRPRDRESVCFCAGELEKSNILGGAVVGVAGYVAAATVGDFAGDFAKGIPNGGAAAVGFWSSFDLVTAGIEGQYDTIELNTGERMYLAVAKPQRKSFGRTAFDMVNC